MHRRELVGTHTTVSFPIWALTPARREGAIECLFRCAIILIFITVAIVIASMIEIWISNGFGSLITEHGLVTFLRFIWSVLSESSRLSAIIQTATRSVSSTRFISLSIVEPISIGYIVLMTIIFFLLATISRRPIIISTTISTFWPWGLGSLIRVVIPTRGSTIVAEVRDEEGLGVNDNNAVRGHSMIQRFQRVDLLRSRIL